MSTATSATSSIRNRSPTSRERSTAVRRHPRTIRTWSVPLAALLIAAAPAAAADAERGKLVFQSCAACHGEGANALGPSLKGVYGRKSAALEDYRYSPAMTR